MYIIYGYNVLHRRMQVCDGDHRIVIGWLFNLMLPQIPLFAP